jgi:hypothetical protein
LKAGLWLRRGRLVKMILLFRHLCRAQAEIPLIFLSKFAEPPLTKVFASIQTNFTRLEGGFALFGRFGNFGTFRADVRISTTTAHFPLL